MWKVQAKSTWVACVTGILHCVIHQKNFVKWELMMKDFFALISSLIMSDHHLSLWLELSEQFLTYTRYLLPNGQGRGSARVRLRGMGRSSVGAKLRGLGKDSTGASLRGMGRGSAGVRLWGIGRGSSGTRMRGMGRGNDAKTALRVIKKSK